MQIKTAGMWCVGAMLLAGSLAACTVDKQEAPALIGPGGSAQQVQLSASPDRLAHNGAAQSVVALSVTNEAGQAVSGQRISVGASTGTSSSLEVVTGADGRASFIVTAPALSTPASSISVFATPFGTNADNALSRSLSITLTGTPVNTTAPTASFSFTPETPVAGDSMVFDASATRDEGQVCGDVCTYTWNFGGLGAGATDGRVVARNTIATGTYAVTVTVRDNAGTVSSITRAVTVAAAPAPPAEEE